QTEVTGDLKAGARNRLAVASGLASCQPGRSEGSVAGAKTDPSLRSGGRAFDNAPLMTSISGRGGRFPGTGNQAPVPSVGRRTFPARPALRPGAANPGKLARFPPGFSTDAAETPRQNLGLDRHGGPRPALHPVRPLR